jgi:6-pyruvoyltetrahydropterin/6-carboxytetrahydropterin synthase
MFAVGVSDHIMIAHSLKGETFGPAQRLHGATYEVRAEVRAAGLDADGIVVDIGALRTALRQTLYALEYRNLDELPEFADRNSTTEVICQHIHTRLSAQLSSLEGADLQVTLVESPVAWASYTAPIAGSS